jgi:hypothetical protein
MAKLIFTRGRQYADLLRSYEILIDGVKQASVRAGENVAIELQPGPHEITAAIDWCRSNPLQLDVQPDGHHVLHVGPKLSGPRLWRGMLYISIWRDRYLYLREADPDTAAWLE